MLANLYRQATGGCHQKRPRLSRNKHQQFRRCVPRNPREAITPFAFDDPEHLHIRHSAEALDQSSHFRRRLRANSHCHFTHEQLTIYA
jgi:hypothetical protein